MSQHDVIYHLTTSQEWEAAKAQTELAPPSLSQEGFVHCSTKEQLLATANRWFAGHDELIVVHIQTAALGTDLVWEGPSPPRPETAHLLFPHVYAAIPSDAILSTHAIQRGPNGHFSD